MTRDQWLVTNDQWQMTSDQWLVTNDQSRFLTEVESSSWPNDSVRSPAHREGLPLKFLTPISISVGPIRAASMASGLYHPEPNAVTEWPLQDLAFLAVDRKVRGGTLCGEMGGSQLTPVTADECCQTVECWATRQRLEQEAHDEEARCLWGRNLGGRLLSFQNLVP